MEYSEIRVLSAREASWLIFKRSVLPKKLCLSVKGCITALSERIRVKNDDMFLFEIDHCVFVIVKDFHLDWHAQLVPLETLVFYNLRLTTIEKGVSKPQPILVAWKTSRILKAPHTEAIICSSLKEWLSWMHLDDLIRSDMVASTCDSIPEEDAVPYFSGKVTNASEADDGIYELDGNVRLVTWLNPSIRGDLCLHIGCRVQVYNVHKVENASGGTTLVCCTRSLIKSNVDPVIKLNMKTAEESLRKQRSTYCLEDMKTTISKYRLNFREVEMLLSWRDSLKDRKSWRGMGHFIYYLAKSFCSGKLEDSSISVLDIFLRHEDFCPFASAKSSECRIQNQLKVALLRELELTDDNSISMKDCNTSKWKFKKKEWKNKEILSGTVVVNEEGQTEFVDQSGKMPVVLIHSWNDEYVSQRMSRNVIDFNACDNKLLSRNDLKLDKHLPHQCSCSCQKVVNATEKLSCPFITPNVVGKTFYVKKFSLVMEHFSSMKGGCESNGEDILLRYLIFSLQDCVMLENLTGNDNCDMVCRLNSYRCLNKQSCIMNNDDLAACLIYTSGKQQRLYSQKRGKNFQLNGRILDPSLVSSKIGKDDIENQLNEKEDKVSLLKRYKDASDINDDGTTTTKNTSLDDKGNDLKRKSEMENISDVTEGSHATKKKKCDNFGSEMNVIEKETTAAQEPLSKSVPMTMCFDKGNICVYPFIQPGRFYLLTSPKQNGSNSKAFEPVFSNEKLGKVLNKCNATMSIQVPEPLEVKGVLGSWTESVREVFDMKDKLPVVSVAQVLSEQHQDSLVSFTAVVLRRETQCSLFSTSNSKASSVDSSLRDVQLVLCDLESYLHSHQDGFIDYVSLYFNASHALYVLGLIPGSVVDVRCVERKVSKSDNVYCRFIAVSSLHVKSVVSSQLGESSEENLRPPNPFTDFAQFPREYIGTIWSRDAADSSSLRRVWHIECHVCVVFSLKLQLLCKKCNGMFLQDRCQSRGCDNTSFDVVVNSVVLVEDGTSQAVVKLRKPNLVSKFLTLCDEQWDDVVSLLQDTGQVYISKQGDQIYSNQLETFLAGLVNSSLIIRPLKMLLRTFKDSHSSSTVAKMKQEEFPVKDLRHGRFSHKVLHLPIFYLDCMDLEEVDC